MENKTSMPYKRGKVHKVELTEKDKSVLEKLTKRHKITQKIIAGLGIGLIDKYGVHNVNALLEAALLEAENSREIYTRQEGDCPALIYAERSHWCVWGRDGKTPEKKKLAKDLDESLEMCLACKKTLEIKLENESYQVKVQELEAKLKDQSSKKFKIPQCQNGARLDSDGLAFEGCPRSPGKIVSIEGYCKKLKNGAGCDWFKLRLVGVGTEA